MKMIYAADTNGAIGNKGKLPWPKIGADMQRFRNATLNHACIMGRKTFDSLPCQLDCRTMLVISSQHKELSRFHSSKKDLYFVPNFDTARKMAPDAFVIGGLQVFLDALPFVNEVWFTFVLSAMYEADVFVSPAQEWFAPPMFDCWEEPQVDLRCRFFRFKRNA